MRRVERFNYHGKATGTTKVQIRKRKHKINENVGSFLGYKIEKIKNLSKKNFYEFIKHKKKFQEMIIASKNIIVATVGTAAS